MLFFIKDSVIFSILWSDDPKGKKKRLVLNDILEMDRVIDNLVFKYLNIFFPSLIQ